MARKSANGNSKVENSPPGRIEVLKTYKMYIGGKFPRTESGRYYTPRSNDTPLGNVCRASRKDLRDAVVAARAAQSHWAGLSAYNRGQILYRVGEMLEGRASQCAAELAKQGFPISAAKQEVIEAIDRMIYYAGWCDKFQQIFSSVNPVASSHFNFSILEPTGVVIVIAAEESPILGLVSLVAPIIASGNTCVVLASESKPLSAITFSEVLNTSDIPGGVVNILTGHKQELAEHFSKHLDVNAIAADGVEPKLLTMIQENAAANIKRVKNYSVDWHAEQSQNPYLIADFCEVKTTWHPVEKIRASGPVY